MTPRLCLLAAVLSTSAMDAAAQIAVTSSSVTERTVAPGEQYRGTLLILNTTDEIQEAKVYQTDYLFFAGGRSEFEPVGTVERSNGGWITFSPSYLTIPPRQTTAVAFSVVAPAEPSAGGGTYWSMLMVESVPKGSAESRRGGAQAPRPGVGIKTLVRYATQVVTHIANTGSAQVEFSDVKVSPAAEGSPPKLQFHLSNTGEKAYRPELWVEIYDERGALAGKFQSTRGLLLPGTSLRQDFVLGGVNPGTYKALLVADLGGEELFGSQHALRF